MPNPLVTPRRALLLGAAGLIAPAALRAQGSPVPIRYATGGGIGPNEMETLIYTEWMQRNVLQGYGRDYTVDMTFTRGTPEAGTLLAAGQADMATLSFSVFATAVLREAVPGGMKIVADNYQDGRPGFASNTFFVAEGSPIRSVQDLRGKRIAVNAFGSAVDIALRVKLSKEGLNPRRDVQVVEVAFPNIAVAIREKRVECGVLVVPFLSAEVARGGLQPLFTGGDAFGPYSVIFHVAANNFLRAQPGAVKAFLADYVRGLKWFYDPVNRAQAVRLAAEVTRQPPEVLDAYFATNRDYYRDQSACLTAALVQAPIDGMQAQGLIPGPVRVADHLDLSYLPMPCSA